MSQRVFGQCTVCYENLSEKEIEKHEQAENYYFTICDACLKKTSDRLFKIVGLKKEAK